MFYYVFEEIVIIYDYWFIIYDDYWILKFLCRAVYK